MKKAVLTATVFLFACAPKRVERAEEPPEAKPAPPPKVEVGPPLPEVEPAPTEVEVEPAPAKVEPKPAREKKFVTRGLGGGGGMFSPSSSPHDPDLMFVNSDMGCLSRSEDGGKSWQVLDQRVTPSNTKCNPLFHPKDPNVVYHAAGRRGLKVSRDRGKTWETLVEDPPWGGDGIVVLAADRASPERMFVGTGKGAFVSLDAGASWKPCEGVEGSVGGIFVDYASPDDARACFVATAKGLFVSADGGASWSGVENAPEGMKHMAGGRSGGKAALFATTANAVWRSLDGGETWREVTPPEAAGKEFRFVGMAETDPQVAYVTDRGKAWTVWKTEDCGDTWQMSFRGPERYGYPDQNVELGWLAVDTNWGWGGAAIGFGVNKAHPEVAMYTNTGELYITRDGGHTWKWGCSERVEQAEPPARGQRWRSTGLEVTTCWQVGFDPLDPSRVVICYTDVGFALSEDGGESWKHSPRGSPWGNTFYKIIFDPEVKGRAYAVACGVHDIPGWRYTGVDIPGRGSGGIVVTDDGCHTWRSVSEGLPKTACVSMELDPKSPPESRTLYCSMYGEGVYKSTDGGRSWEKKSAGLGVGENMHVYALHLHENGTLYCSITGRRRDLVFEPPGGLFKSADGAETWESLTEGVEIYWPAEFAVHPKDPNVIYLCSSDVPNLSTGGVWRTKDGGGSWEQIIDKTKLPQEYLGFCHVFAPYFHPKDPSTIYLSTWTHGLWISRDAGETWKENKRIPTLSINRVTVDPRDPETIWVTTYGEGVWKGPAVW